MFRLPTTFAALALAALAAGCSRSPEPKPAPASPPGPTESDGPVPGADTAVELPDAAEATKATVVARVGARDISADEVVAVVDQLAREGKVQLTPKAIRAVLDAMIADAVIAEEARAEGFDDSALAKRSEDAALASLYLDQKTRAEAEAAVTDEDVQRYWGPRRRATTLVLATRDEASALQQTILEAIETTPERATEIFQDFRAKAPLTKGAVDQGATVPFDARGGGRVNEPVVHARVAQAAFAMPKVGAVSPPVEVGPARWALVQLLAMDEGLPPEALTAEQKDEARKSLVAARAALARKALAARIRDAAEVRVDDARLDELIASLSRVRPQQKGRVGIDLQRLRNGRLKTLPSRLPPGARRLKDMRKGTPEGDEHRPPPRRRPDSRPPTPPGPAGGETP